MGPAHRPVGATVARSVPDARLHHRVEQAPMEKGVYSKFAHTEGRSALRYSPDGKCVRSLATRSPGYAQPNPRSARARLCTPHVTTRRAGKS